MNKEIKENTATVQQQTLHLLFQKGISFVNLNDKDTIIAVNVHYTNSYCNTLDAKKKWVI